MRLWRVKLAVCATSRCAGAAKMLGGRAFCEEHYAAGGAEPARAVARHARPDRRAGRCSSLPSFSLAPAVRDSLQGPALVFAGLLLALVPAAIWMVVFYLQDRAEPEPKQYVFGVFLLGVLLAAAIGQPLIQCLPRERMGRREPGAAASRRASASSASSRSFSSTPRCVTPCFGSAEFDERIDGIIYGAAAGLGYATFLNVNYVISNGGVDLGIGAVRIAVVALAQASFAGVTGYFLGRAKFENRGPFWLPVGLLLAAVLNGVVTTLLSEITRTGSAADPAQRPDPRRRRRGAHLYRPVRHHPPRFAARCRPWQEERTHDRCRCQNASPPEAVPGRRARMAGVGRRCSSCWPSGCSRGRSSSTRLRPSARAASRSDIRRPGLPSTEAAWRRAAERGRAVCGRAVPGPLRHRCRCPRAASAGTPSRSATWRCSGPTTGRRTCWGTKCSNIEPVQVRGKDAVRVDYVYVAEPALATPNSIPIVAHGADILIRKAIPMTVARPAVPPSDAFDGLGPTWDRILGSARVEVGGDDETPRIGRHSRGPGLLSLVFGLAGSAPRAEAVDKDVAQRILRASVKLLTPMDADENAGSLCSGSMLDQEGYILTNFHCIGYPTSGPKDQELEEPGPAAGRPVQLEGAVGRGGDGRPAEAARSPPMSRRSSPSTLNSTLPCLRSFRYYNSKQKSTDTLPVMTMPVADSETVETLDDVIVVGYPGIAGDTVTATEGRISGFIDEDGDDKFDWFKTDVLVNQGNSGGSALNAKGELIGMPTARLQDKSGNVIYLIRPVNRAVALHRRGAPGGRKRRPGRDQSPSNAVPVRRRTERQGRRLARSSFGTGFDDNIGRHRRSDHVPHRASRKCTPGCRTRTCATALIGATAGSTRARTSPASRIWSGSSAQSGVLDLSLSGKNGLTRRRLQPAGVPAGRPGARGRVHGGQEPGQQPSPAEAGRKPMKGVTITGTIIDHATQRPIQNAIIALPEPRPDGRRLRRGPE